MALACFSTIFLEVSTFGFLCYVSVLLLIGSELHPKTTKYLALIFPFPTAQAEVLKQEFFIMVVADEPGVVRRPLRAFVCIHRAQNEEIWYVGGCEFRRFLN
jgi:hypothetical protein